MKNNAEINMQMRWEKMRIELSVDGRRIPMNEFVQKIVISVIKAMVETLHTVDSGWKEISIHIERDEIKE